MKHVWILACVAAAGCQKIDPLYCASHSDPACGPSDAGITPTDAPPGFFTIGGTVLDTLAGTGLVLENNAGDDLMIMAPGAFQFTMPIEMGMPYDVRVSSQPTNPSQSCSVVNGSGTATDTVTDVTVACTTDTFNIGGAVYGLNSGQSVTLLLNGGNSLAVIGDGTTKGITFTTALPSNSTFGVTVGTQPAIQTCTVSGGNGTVGDADVTTVIVNCAPNSYTVAGMISGLNGKAVLTDGHDMITVSANGSFSFPPLTAPTTYTVTVTTQPSYPPVAQTCTVTSGGPSPLTMNVTTVVVTCATNAYTIGGSVAALTGTLILSDNGGDNKTITANGAFTFATPVASGSTYAVTVKTEPSGQFCTISLGNGTVTNANVTTVSVACDSGTTCGSSSCNPANHECCDPEGGQTCTKLNSSCSHLELFCDDTADCTLAGTPGSCCSTEMTGQVKSVGCTTMCMGPGQFILCDPAVIGACPMGKTCKPYARLPGYNDCQ